MFLNDNFSCGFDSTSKITTTTEHLLYLQKSFKISKGQPEDVDRRRTDNTKEKKTKGQAMISKTLHRKLKIEYYCIK